MAKQLHDWLTKDHRLDLSGVLDTVIDDRIKGIPGGTRPFKLDRIGTHGWNVLSEDLPLPVVVLKRSALESNLDLMRQYCEHSGVRLAPHGKTTMAPQLFAAQLAAGAWALTAATVEQLNVYAAVKVPRVVFANQIVGRPHVTEVVRRLAGDPDFELVSFVDSPTSVTTLADAARAARLDRRFQVVAEIGYVGGRTGIRDDDALDEVADAIRRNGDVVELVGVAGYEGLLNLDRTSSRSDLEDTAVHAFLRRMIAAAARFGDRGLLSDNFILTAGGSRTFDAVVDVLSPAVALPAHVVLRSGCYITHDHGMYAKSSPLEAGNTSLAQQFGSLLPALEVWAYVQSVPEPELALLTCGRRDVPFDAGFPVPLRRIPSGAGEPEPLTDSRVVELNDQHAYMKGTDRVSVGDRVVLGISHPCTAFDKWRLIPVVDDDYTVVDGILTFF